MKKKDIILIICALALAAGLYALSQITLGAPATAVVVLVDGREALRKPLSVDGRYEIAQEDGSLNILEVSGGAVRMVEANCRDGLCISQGVMRSAAKTIVCLPHNLIVRLEGDGAKDDDGLDVIL